MNLTHGGSATTRVQSLVFNRHMLLSYMYIKKKSLVLCYTFLDIYVNDIDNDNDNDKFVNSHRHTKF